MLSTLVLTFSALILHSSSTPLSAKELKQIMDFFLAQFAEPHNRVFAAALDALCDFVSLYRADCTPSFLMDLLNALLTKLGGDLVATTHSRVCVQTCIGMRKRKTKRSMVFEAHAYMPRQANRQADGEKKKRKEKKRKDRRMTLYLGASA